MSESLIDGILAASGSLSPHTAPSPMPDAPTDTARLDAAEDPLADLSRGVASVLPLVVLSAPLNRWTSRPEQKRDDIMQNGPRASRCLTARTMECTNVTREGKEDRERENGGGGKKTLSSSCS